MNVTMDIITLAICAATLAGLLAIAFTERHKTTIPRPRANGRVPVTGTRGIDESTTLSNRLAQLVLERPTDAVLTVEEPLKYIIPSARQTAGTNRRTTTAPIDSAPITPPERRAAAG